MNDYANIIKTAHAKVVKAMQSSLQHAKEAGESLALVQAGMNNKEFGQWCKTECGLSESTAFNYIRIHKNYKDVENEENYSQALKALRQTRKEKKQKPVQPLTTWQEELKQRAEQFCIKATPINLELFLASFGIKEVKEQVTQQINLAA